MLLAIATAAIALMGSLPCINASPVGGFREWAVNNTHFMAGDHCEITGNLTYPGQHFVANCTHLIFHPYTSISTTGTPGTDYSGASCGRSPASGTDGQRGGNITILTKQIVGTLVLYANGGKGGTGQCGADGNAGADGKRGGDNGCYPWPHCGSCSISGDAGQDGQPGQDGADAGKSGNGGDGGDIYLELDNTTDISNIKREGGSGGAPVSGGKGGAGGHGGAGGMGCEGSCNWICECHHDTCCQGPTGKTGSEGHAGKSEPSGSSGKRGKLFLVNSSITNKN